LFACAIGYATSRAIGAPMTQLLSNAQLARNGNIELMRDVNTGLREIDETGEILKELATQLRRRGLWGPRHPPVKYLTTVDDRDCKYTLSFGAWA
jgi:hypothetical protein